MDLDLNLKRGGDGKTTTHATLPAGQAEGAPVSPLTSPGVPDQALAKLLEERGAAGDPVIIDCPGANEPITLD
jgi:hypothetical protein